MKVVKILNKFLIGLIIIVTFFFVTGIAYSYFVANLFGTETDTTITVEAGQMDIEYDGGPNITIGNFEPSSEPIVTKTISITGNSTLDSDNLGYIVTLIIDENTFTEGAF